MRRITLFFITAVTGCITSLPLAAATLITSDGHISGNSTWTSAGSPYRISGTLTVDPGVKLVIEPGVEVQLEERAGITIHGTLQARGSSSLLIHFLPADEETHWGHILFSDTTATPSYDDQLVFRQGSILEYCVFEGGGNVPAEDYNGGTVACIQASPVIQDCRFMGNRAPRGGAILCHRFSAPLIRRNTFSDNAATVDDGGGICIFLYSNPIIQDNLFLRNRAARSGGAIYLSVANATIKHNTLINNNADEYGGGIYMSSTQAIIEENAFLNNHGWDGSGTLYLVADSCPQIRRNSLAGSGYLVYLDNVTCPVELRENWWQTVNEVEVELKIRKSFTRKPTIPIIYQPILLSPPESLPTQPVELKQLRIMTDRTWSEELRNDLAPDARIQVEIQAEDRNPWSRDQTATRLYILDKPLQSFELILQETELASGIFRGEAWVRNETNPLEREIGAVVGDTIVVESTIDPAFHQQYHVGEGVPYVSNFSFTSEIDISHVIDPAIELSWNYFDLRRHPQQQIQIQIATNADFAPPDLLDTGFFAYTETSWKYDGARLVDGQKYHLRIRVSDGERYSPWNSITIRNDNAVYSFRMNSLPALPGVVAPVAGTVVNQSQPLLQCEEMADAEGDQLNYEFELFETEFRRQLVTSGNGDRPQFKPSVSLPDNATRWWRVRIYDGFEYTHWSELYSFQVNSVEEPPTGPGLLEPFGSTYSLSPLFRWLPAEDPDPQAELHYYLQLSTTGSFATAEKLPAGDGTSMQLQESISNGVEYFWSVTAVDQTGRETASRIGKFQADTQPSLPLLSYPLNRQELGSGLTFQVVAAVDPDPGDQLIYDLQ
ncbi:MAG: right-handed parallel beta-helix repeat-containing protein, partial [Candidatus Delongbacteria bacterium]|nr:right-handed parallel beta-helix repeat-containing protein [Candidatus Delongbacteria bacterium]